MSLPINEIYNCIQGEGKFAGVPHLLIRFTGCPMRCQFSVTDFCDTPYSSWAPEKGNYTREDLYKLIDDNPQIKHVMITGGSPTMHPELLIEVCSSFRSKGFYITIETEGSSFVRTDAQFISLSPKLSSSTPRVGTNLPWGNQVKEQQAIIHERHRCNYTAMKAMINNHSDYQLKFVISQEEDIKEVMSILHELDSPPSEKVYLMPAGANRDELSLRRLMVIDQAIKYGFNYTDRLHIIAYNNLRGV